MLSVYLLIETSIEKTTKWKLSLTWKFSCGELKCCFTCSIFDLTSQFHLNYLGCAFMWVHFKDHSDSWKCLRPSITTKFKIRIKVMESRFSPWAVYYAHVRKTSIHDKARCESQWLAQVRCVYTEIFCSISLTSIPSVTQLNLVIGSTTFLKRMVRLLVYEVSSWNIP